MNKIFEKGGKLSWLHSTVDAFETFLHVPGTVTRKGSHVRDAIDTKRVIIIALIATIPAALFGMWNTGYQHSLATGAAPAFWADFFYGLLKVLPLYVVAYAVGLFIEFASAQIRDEEVNEGYLMTGFIIPLIVPVDVPLWMLAVAVAFAVIFGKEVFGGTGMNIWNPALLTRAFLFFSYPNNMSGSDCWVAFKKGETAIDAFSGATPLAVANEGGMDALNNAGYSFMDMFLGTIPGSVGETSALAILLGAVILIWTGVASWKIMVSSVAGGLLVGWLGTLCGATDVPCWYHLVMGGFAFGTVFMATDPVTSAQTSCGKWIYGFLVGAIAVIVRLFNPGYAEGMMLAILLGNTFAPLIDHCVVSAHLSKKAKKVNIA
ncbi:MAG: NADH:ubiquinone reductase (Na(+)-transporting) subunit B [Bacteroidales bacterium]|nr:NADH:ubiquinone reductase (Na(+)-transporting) subunit B [Candidatus Cryptobacteroides onthequi]MCQ2165689.1 NADH:ubiquinone reductase (Na(+)-transporting) subunit B [Bacteroidales bacterium]